MIKEFYVLFEEGETWWRWLTKAEFGHISVIACVDSRLIKVYPGNDMLGMQYVGTCPPLAENRGAYEKRIFKLSPDATILYVKTDVNPRFTFCPPLKFITCTTIVKYLMGIKCWSITPWGFYKYLTNPKRLDKNPGVLEVRVIQDGEK